jgi:polysaccharide biosynthesis protein PslH
MKILLITPMPPRVEAPGAIPLVLQAELTGLSARHQVSLVTVVGDEPGEDLAAAELRATGVDVHVVDRRRPSGAARWQRRRRLASSWARGRYPWRTVWFADPRVQQLLDRLTRSEHFDVAVVEDNSMGIFALPPELPAVLTEHEVRRPRAVDWHCGPPNNWARWLLGEADERRWRTYQPSVWRRFDAVQVFSRRDAEGVAELAPDVAPRVRVNPFGVVLPEPADPARAEPGLLLFAGNFTHPPNVDAALWLGKEIMPRLRERSPGVKLLLAGPAAPPAVWALRGRDITVLGEVPTIKPYVEAAAVVLAPVRTGGGMRMKVLHAMASEKAVVTTSFGVDGLMLGPGEQPVAIADDVQGIVCATTKLLGDEALRRRLAARARAYAVEHHSPDAYARRLEAVFEEVITGHTGFPEVAPVGHGTIRSLFHR